jgi:hypothetical protein
MIRVWSITVWDDGVGQQLVCNNRFFLVPPTPATNQINILRPKVSRQTAIGFGPEGRRFGSIRVLCAAEISTRNARLSS